MFVLCNELPFVLASRQAVKEHTVHTHTHTHHRHTQLTTHKMHNYQSAWGCLLEAHMNIHCLHIACSLCVLCVHVCSAFEMIFMSLKMYENYTKSK